MSDKPNFTGNAEQKALAAQIFQLMSSQGAFFASDSPIKQTLANLADFIAVQRKADRAKVEAALLAWAKEAKRPLCQVSMILARATDHAEPVARP